MPGFAYEFSYRYAVPGNISGDHYNGSCDGTTSKYPWDANYPPLDYSCLQEMYTEGDGVCTETTSANYKYDPRIRPWYTVTKALGRESWSPVYLFAAVGNPVGISYSVPIYNTNNNLALVLLFDYVLEIIQEHLVLLNAEDIVDFIISDKDELIATSSGEPLSVVRNVSEPTKLSIKYANETTNSVIKESFLFTKAENITKDGVYSFVAIDGASYTFQVTTWSDLTKTINWRVFVVSRNLAYHDSSLESVIDVDQLANDLALDLTTFADDAIAPAGYLAVFTGKFSGVPFRSAIIDTNSSSEIKLTREALWGTISSNPAYSFAMRLGYADKAFFEYVKGKWLYVQFHPNLAQL